MTLKLWTVSYEGRSIEDIVDKLRDNGIERVVHIGTVSQDIEGSRFEDHLRKRLEGENILFEHIDNVGQPPEYGGIVAERGKEGTSSAFNAYLSRRSDEMNKLRQKIEERPTAILCYQQGERACEGSVLVQLLQREGSEIKNL